MATNDDIELDLKRGENEEIGQYRLRIKNLVKNNPKAKFKLEVNDAKVLANLGSELLNDTLKGKISNIQLNCDHFGSPNAPQNSTYLGMLYKNNPKAQWAMQGRDPNNIITIATGSLKNVFNRGDVKIELTAKNEESAKPLIQILSKAKTPNGTPLTDNSILKKINFSDKDPKTGKTPNPMTPKNKLGDFVKNTLKSPLKSLLNPFDTRKGPRPDDKFRQH